MLPARLETPVTCLSTSGELTSLSDDGLVAIARTGRHEALDVLFQRHYLLCLNQATLIMRDRADAEDEVQKAYWKVFAHLEQLQSDSGFLPWLRRIVTNQCLMALRSRRRVHLESIDSASDAADIFPIGLRSLEDDPEQRVLHNEAAGLVRNEICRIPPLLRNILVLRHVDQLPVAEVADRLGISVPAAKSRLHRACRELRNRLLEKWHPAIAAYSISN